jgi:hypothetical protein
VAQRGLEATIKQRRWQKSPLGVAAKQKASFSIKFDIKY